MTGKVMIAPTGWTRMIGVEVGQRYYQIMNATPWVAWIGACSGLGSLLWNIYTKVTSGARLRVTAYAGMILMPPPPHNPRILKIAVKNIGTVTTTITNVTFHSYGSRWKRFKNRADVNAVINTHSGPQFPHKLEVGGQWVATMEQDDKFDDWLKAGDLWCAIHHAFCEKPTQVKIFAPSVK